MNKTTSYYLLLVFVLITSSVIGQTYKFNQFTQKDGLPHPFIYTINQDDQGYIWIGTGEGLVRYDGNAYEILDIGDSLNADFITTTFKDKSGNLWFGHNSGRISTYKNGQIEPQLLVDVKSKINSICEDNHGNIYFASQNDGIIKLTPKLELSIFHQALEEYIIYAIIAMDQNEFIVGTDQGLLHYIDHSDGANPTIKNIEGTETRIQCIYNRSNKNNGFLIGTEDEGVYELDITYQGFQIKHYDEFKELREENILSIIEDNSGDLWLGTKSNGLLKICICDDDICYNSVQRFNAENSLNTNFINSLFQDFEGNIWVGTYGKGINLIKDYYFSYFCNHEDNKRSIFAIYADTLSIWFSTDSGIVKSTATDNVAHFLPLEYKGLPSDKATSIYRDIENTTWIGTETSGLFYLKEGDNTFKLLNLSEDYLERSINTITGNNENIYVATKGGLFVYNIKTKDSDHIATEDGLPHNNINYVYVDGNNAWIASQSNVLTKFISKDNIHKHIISKDEIINIKGITKDDNGYIWLASYGNGVFKLMNDTVLKITTNQGLLSDYCYSITADVNNNIWVGHRNGISRIYDDVVVTFDETKGISGECNSNAIFNDQKGNIWFGTTEGAIKYDIGIDNKEVSAPKINLSSLSINDQQKNLSNTINLPYGIYRIKLDFVGILFSDPKSIQYKYKLDGHDLDWSKLGYNSFAEYKRIEDGTYVFHIQACAKNNICSEETILLNIIIEAPYWKKWWFIALSILTFVLIIYLIIVFRERNHRRLENFLKQKLYERTSEVLSQKKEIELQRDQLKIAIDEVRKKNKDITDSIQYAQRIQEAILPSRRAFRRHFKNFFAYFKPRDIVSGDFYWFDFYKGKAIIVCADATGHGVPGAFMSMIGITLLKDIIRRPKINSPSDILKTLDKEIRTILIPKYEENSSQDGMDLSICEIDVKTNLIRFSTALRPMIFIKNNKLEYFKGNRIAIGGSEEEKDFKDFEIQLRKDDMIYMFSDGYYDQFGGPNEKKMKISRLKETLIEIHHLPIEEQRYMIKKTFLDWKGNYEQVDDVLFIGAKIS